MPAGYEDRLAQNSTERTNAQHHIPTTSPWVWEPTDTKNKPKQVGRGDPPPLPTVTHFHHEHAQAVPTTGEQKYDPASLLHSCLLTQTAADGCSEMFSAVFNDKMKIYIKLWTKVKTPANVG